MDQAKNNFLNSRFVENKISLSRITKIPLYDPRLSTSCLSSDNCVSIECQVGCRSSTSLKCLIKSIDQQSTGNAISTHDTKEG